MDFGTEYDMKMYALIKNYYGTITLLCISKSESEIKELKKNFDSRNINKSVKYSLIIKSTKNII